ncbi:MAG: GlmU family protein, partial [Cyclobacteriaceae bacterium]|nr:GlmU family protein [Cyclobacteriaceae bacterium]
MSNLILFDPLEIREALLPLTFTKPVAKIRIGILTIDKKWEKRLNTSASFLTQDYLSEKYPLSTTDDNLFVNGALCPNEAILEAIHQLDAESCLLKEGILLAIKTRSNNIKDNTGWSPVEFKEECNLIDEVWKIFQLNAVEIKADFDFITKNRTSQPLTDPHTIVYGKENLFIEEGAVIKAAIINAEKGPVYIGKNAQIHEGAIIKGAFALCESAHVNIGAKIRGDTTIGPHCKIGGEVSNSVIFKYSNKGHEGYLGNSVLGEWCNIGADTNTSNLKNNYADVKIWNYSKEGFKDTKQMFCGLIMGDHSKCGINTMFNTGTVVGVSANIYGPGFPRNFVPSFSWGGAAGFTTFQLRKVYEVAEKVMGRKNID